MPGSVTYSQVWGIKAQTSLEEAIIIPALMSKCFEKYSDFLKRENYVNICGVYYLYVTDLTKFMIIYNEII